MVLGTPYEMYKQAAVSMGFTWAAGRLAGLSNLEISEIALVQRRCDVHGCDLYVEMWLARAHNSKWEASLMYEIKRVLVVHAFECWDFERRAVLHDRRLLARVDTQRQRDSGSRSVQLRTEDHIYRRELQTATCLQRFFNAHVAAEHKARMSIEDQDALPGRTYLNGMSIEPAYRQSSLGLLGLRFHTLWPWRSRMSLPKLVRARA